jgi:hypothetical protein
MQYVSRHSSSARRAGSQPLLQPIATLGGQHAAFAAAGLPSLSADTFAMPALPRLPRAEAVDVPGAAAVRPTRRAVSRPTNPTRFALSLGVGSTMGMLLGALLCSLFAS